MLNNSLSDLKNPSENIKPTNINDGDKLNKDCLLIYTIQTTSNAYSGAGVFINNVKIAGFIASTPNNQVTLVGSIRGFKDDIVKTDISNFGGNVSVVAYYL